MAKKVTNRIKLQIMGGDAKPAPPVGPALGQAGVNIPLFCKDFNARTAHMAADKMPVPVFITVYSDRTFEFKVGTPPASALLRKAAGAEKGSGEPNKKKIGTITQAQLNDIATTKLPDLNTSDHAAAVRTIAGTAKSMGININN